MRVFVLVRSLFCISSYSWWNIETIAFAKLSHDAFEILSFLLGWEMLVVPAALFLAVWPFFLCLFAFRNLKTTGLLFFLVSGAFCGRAVMFPLSLSLSFGDPMNDLSLVAGTFGGYVFWLIAFRVRTETIYMYLPDEAVDVWRPVQAKKLEAAVYYVLGPVPKEEVWQFAPGSIVQVEMRRLEDSDLPVAVAVNNAS